jgi:hypothetical protein
MNSVYYLASFVAIFGVIYWAWRTDTGPGNYQCVDRPAQQEEIGEN